MAVVSAALGHFVVNVSGSSRSWWSWPCSVGNEGVSTTEGWTASSSGANGISRRERKNRNMGSYNTMRTASDQRETIKDEAGKGRSPVGWICLHWMQGSPSRSFMSSKFKRNRHLCSSRLCTVRRKGLFKTFKLGEWRKDGDCGQNIRWGVGEGVRGKSGQRNACGSPSKRTRGIKLERKKHSLYALALEIQKLALHTKKVHIGSLIQPLCFLCCVTQHILPSKLLWTSISTTQRRNECACSSPVSNLTRQNGGIFKFLSLVFVSRG